MTIQYCSEFCKEGIETPFGLHARGLIHKTREKGSDGKYRNYTIFKPEPLDPAGQKRGFKCPFGFTHNPRTEKATLNIIQNGGRHSLCHRNPWKWRKPKGE